MAQRMRIGGRSVADWMRGNSCASALVAQAPNLKRRAFLPALPIVLAEVFERSWERFLAGLL